MKMNHFIEHQLQVNIEFFYNINELTYNFNLRYFCFNELLNFNWVKKLPKNFQRINS